MRFWWPATTKRLFPVPLPSNRCKALKPTLADYGVSIHKSARDFFNITTDRMLLEPAVEAAAMKILTGDGAQPTFTYLANYILADDGRGKIPYSTVAAVDFSDRAPLGLLLIVTGSRLGPWRMTKWC